MKDFRKKVKIFQQNLTLQKMKKRKKRKIQEKNHKNSEENKMTVSKEEKQKILDLYKKGLT